MGVVVFMGIVVLIVARGILYSLSGNSIKDRDWNGVVLSQNMNDGMTTTSVRMFFFSEKDVVSAYIQLCKDLGPAIDIGVECMEFKDNFMYFKFSDSFYVNGFGIIKQERGGFYWLNLMPVPISDADRKEMGEVPRSISCYGEFLLEECRDPKIKNSFRAAL